MRSLLPERTRNGKYRRYFWQYPNKEVHGKLPCNRRGGAGSISTHALSQLIRLPLNRVAFTIYLIVLILSPLLFGAVHTYAYTLMTLGVLTGTLLIIIKNFKKGNKRGAFHFQFPNTNLNLIFFPLLLFLAFQIIPLPPAFLEFLSPETKVVSQKSLPCLTALGFENQSKEWYSLSPYYYPVRMSFIRFSVYGLFFFGLIQTLTSQKRIELILLVLLMLGCFEVLYGLVQSYSGSGHIWWFKSISDSNAITGTYINRNHFAGLMEMGLLLAASYSAALSVRKKKQTASAHRSGLSAGISHYLSREQQFNKRAFIFLAGVVMGVGVIFSASRGGMIATAGGMLCMSLFFIFRRPHRKRGFALLFLFLITVLYALHIGAEYPVGRFNDFPLSFEKRARYSKKSMNMFADYRFVGVGVGNFQYIYPKYQAAEDSRVFIRHAHNDWGQFLAEAGILGLCLLAAGMSYYVYQTMKLWKKRSDPFAVCLGIVPLGAMAAVAIHSWSDFNLHIPANFLMLSAVVAIGYSALHLERRHGKKNRVFYPYRNLFKYKAVFFCPCF